MRSVGDTTLVSASAVQAAPSRRTNRASPGHVMAEPATGQRFILPRLGPQRWIGALEQEGA